MCQDLAMYFVEKGKVMTADEYIKAEDSPLHLKTIKKIAKSYSRAILMMNQSCPDLLKLLVEKEVEKVEAAPEPKVAPIKVPKKPKAPAKPRVAKPAKAKESKDE